jgi:hypothetical protein
MADINYEKENPLLQEVGARLTDILQEKELTHEQLVGETYKLVTELGVYEGSEWKFRVSHPFLADKLVDGKRVHGLVNEYFVLNDGEMSEEARSDIELFEKLEQGAQEYVKSQIEGKPIGTYAEDDLSNLVRSYLFEQPEFQEFNERDILKGAEQTGRISGSLPTKYRDMLRMI